MQLLGTQLTNTSALAGNDVATFPDFPAEIRAPRGTRAGVSGFQVQFSSEAIFTPGDVLDALVVMNPAAMVTNIADLAATLNKYEDTEVLIEGHTDADGSEAHNQTLSDARAQSVRKQLITTGVRAGRISTVGYGEAQPIADNTTDAGKAQNRRVEIAIYANDRMKKAAERGEL